MQSISFFLRINFFITTIIYLAFLTFNHDGKLTTQLFSIMATISTSATIYLIIYLLFRLFFYFSRTITYTLAIVFFTINSALLIDFIIYKVWKFHINAMVVNILTSPAAYDSLQLNSSGILIAGLSLFFLLYIEYILYKFIQKIEIKKLSNFNKKFNYILIPLLFIIVLTEKIIFGLASVYKKQYILESVKPIPLYQPLTFSHLAEKYLDVKIDKNKNQSLIIQKSSQLNYPLHKIELKKDTNSPNIFIFMFDAARESILNQEVSPNVINFSKESLVFKNHISGGNATRFGIFSIFYGLNSTYWFNFLNAQKEPIFFQVLKEKSYQTKIISSTTTKWPEFRQTTYYGIQNSIEDDFEGEPYEKDQQCFKSFKKWMENVDNKQPIFSFVFLDSPHGYSYPDKFEKFKPNMGNNGLNYLNVKKDDKKELLNSYKNAIYFNDKLFGDMIDILKNKDLYKNSIIIFSSDHGQEFFEYGSFGHNSSFSKAQINSPFIMKLPNNEPKTITKMTSHLDVVPSLLTLLGVKNPPKDYSLGFDMLSDNYHRKYSYVANWNKNAIITANYTHVYSNLPNEIFKNEVRENQTYKKIKNKTNDNIETILLEVLEQNRRFIK